MKAWWQGLTRNGRLKVYRKIAGPEFAAQYGQKEADRVMDMWAGSDTRWSDVSSKFHDRLKEYYLNDRAEWEKNFHTSAHEDIKRERDFADRTTKKSPPPGK